ncbi:MAG: helix-turn-helix transcriptional regulator [Chitinophagales bacterium]|nr:helix-turn-helix transcriptional regulator [Chitinophagales bacterium]
MTDNTTIINHNNCPGQEILNVLATKWVPSIFKVMHREPVRFSELLKALPGSNKQSLSVALHQMEKHGLIEKKIIKEKPLHIEYNISDTGTYLLDVFKTLSEISTINKQKEIAAI